MRFLEQFGRDLLLAWRGLRRAPTFAVIVVATIAIGIGANATVLGIMDVYFLRDLPVADPDRIVRIRCTDSTAVRDGASSCSFREVRDLQEHVGRVAGIAAFHMTYVKLGGDLAGLEPYGSFVSGNYFSVLGVQPQRGRFLLEDDADPASPRPVVVISDYLWRNSLGANERAVGSTLVIGRTDFTIVGIMPVGWSGVHPEGRSDFWLAYTAKGLASGENDYVHRDARVIWPKLVARMADGVTLAQVQGSLNNAARDLRARYPELNSRTAYRATIERRIVGPAGFANALPAFIVALMIVGLVHFVACSNVASLMLARAAARRRELGIRLCLGASRNRILMQALAEPLVLAVFGAGLGLVLQRWFTGLIASMWFMSAANRGLDARVVTIVALVAGGTALVFGLAPALMSTRQDPLDVLRAGSATRSLNKATSPESILVLQAAMSLLLLVQSQLLVGKFQRENAADLGFDDSRIVMGRVQLSATRFTQADWKPLYDIAMARAASVPGVTRVSAATSTPLEFGGWFEPITMTRADGGVEESRSTMLATIGPEYFRTLGAPLVSGREFTAADRSVAGQPSRFDVVVVNEAFAKRHWPGLDPIGRTVTFRKAPARVVGVVKDLRDNSLSGTSPRVYFPMLQFRYNRFFVVVQADGDIAAVGQRLRSALTGIPNVDAPVIRTIADARADRLSVPKTIGLVMSAAAGIALLLTAIGLYGAVSMWAAARRIEIGIRLALGARAQHVHRLLILGAGRFTVIGLAVGAVGAIALVRVEQARFGPTLSMQPGAALVAAAIFLAVTLLAAFIPARRAARTNPAEVFKGE
jgi:putative ABC transport system permease protein